MFKRRKLRSLRKMQQRYRQEAEQKQYELDFSSYLMSLPERKQTERAKRDLERKIEALDVVIDDLYVQLNGKVQLD